MRIGLVATSIVRKARRAGTGRYIRNLLRCLASLGNSEERYLLVSRENLEDFAAAAAGFKVICVVMPQRGERYLEQFVLPWYLNRLNLDCVHFVNYAPSLAYRGASVLTVYDLTNRLYPSRVGWQARAYHRFFADYGAKRVDRVIAVSKSTKADIVELLKIDPSRVRIIYGGVDPVFSTSVSPFRVKSVLEKYGIKGSFVLGVNTLEPIKNTRRLVEAFYALCQGERRRLQLVLVGQAGWGVSIRSDAVGAGSVTGRLKIVGYVPDTDLAALYRAATVFVYPSLYEGFGLPPLEAMASGVPVIVSNRASLPEVVGDAGLLVDPESTEDLTSAMKEVLRSSALRKTMIEKGKEQARRFSWSRCAEQTLRLYHEIGADTG